MAYSEKPILVTVLSLLTGLTGLIFILLGLNLIEIKSVELIFYLMFVASTLSGQFLTIWGIVLIIVAVGLFRLWKLAMYALGAFHLFSLFIGLTSGNWFALGASFVVLVVLYMNRHAFSGEEL